MTERPGRTALDTEPGGPHPPGVQPEPPDRHDAPDRDIRRLRWVSILVPIAFIWIVELGRFLVLDNLANEDLGHVISALIMAGGVVFFAVVMSSLLDRTQGQLVRQNRDLTAMYGVSQEVRGGTSNDETLRAALTRMVHETDALAGLVRIEPTPGEVIVVRHPERLPDGLAWVTSLLDEHVAAPAREPRFGVHGAVDAAVLDVPLIAADEAIGVLRLAYHPVVRPTISDAALMDIGGELATAARLAALMADLRRRERESAALYAVSLQLTGRTELTQVLDTITHHARELLHGERAVVCLSTAKGPASVVSSGPIDRMALPDEGCACLIGHGPAAEGHGRSEACPLHPRGDHVAFLARPLRAPDGPVGELCVTRTTGGAFSDRERALLDALAEMAAIAVSTARLREAEGQWLILSERDRIARELHDSIAQVLGVLHMRLRAIAPAAPQGPGGERMRAEIDDLATIADESYRDVREAILGLRETVHAEKGLAGALTEYLAKYGRQTGITARLVVEDPAATRFSPRVEVQLLRVVQEALTNVRKHAQARSVIVRLARDGETTVLSIEDDGAGFDPGDVARSFGGGFGLSTMRERVEQVGGTLDVHTARGEGTRVIVRLGPEGARVTPAAAASDHPGR